MKSNTWLVVVAAVAVTASMVIAKSFLPAPGAAGANPPAGQVADAPLLLNDRTFQQTVAQPATILDTPQSIASAEMSQPDSAAPAPDSERWTVLVVRGNKIDYVTYPNPHVKGQAP